VLVVTGLWPQLKNLHWHFAIRLEEAATQQNWLFESGKISGIDSKYRKELDSVVFLMHVDVGAARKGL